MEDLLVKLVRLLANLSINHEVGPIVSETKGIEQLSELLKEAFDADREELMLNTVSCLTNLSYYLPVDSNEASVGEGSLKDLVQWSTNLIYAQKDEICAHLVPVLLHQNEEAIVEAARALGNFSRSHSVRQLIARKRVDEANIPSSILFLTYLSHDSL